MRRVDQGSKDSALAAKAWQGMVAAAAGRPQALALLAFRGLGLGQDALARQAAEQALALAPHDPEVVAHCRAVLAAGVPAWHFPMMRDAPRNLAYQQAIERAVRPGMRVLDVGSGSGLLAMMAARAGAASVVSCERNLAIAEVAQDIVARNGFADRVTVLHRDSLALDVDADLGGPVDLVISEIIGKDVVCEKVLPSLVDVARRLLKPGGQMLPAAAEARVALAQWTGHVDVAAREDQCGFDLTPFNRLATQRWSVPVGDRRLALRSPADSVLRFDLAATAGHPLSGSVTLHADGEPFNGVVQWVGLQLDEAGWFENAPAPGATSSWACLFTPFAETLCPAPGTPVTIGARVLSDRLILWQAAA